MKNEYQISISTKILLRKIPIIFNITIIIYNLRESVVTTVILTPGAGNPGSVLGILTPFPADSGGSAGSGGEFPGPPETL